jgi:hypothetical protein
MQIGGPLRRFSSGLWRNSAVTFARVAERR